MSSELTLLFSVFKMDIFSFILKKNTKFLCQILCLVVEKRIISKMTEKGVIKISFDKPDGISDYQEHLEPF